jgi:cell division protease FtsH
LSRPEEPEQPLPRWALYLALGLLALLVLYWAGPPADAPVTSEITYTRFKQLVLRGEVAEVTFRGDEIRALLDTPITPGPAEWQVYQVATRLPPLGDPELLPALEARGVDIRSLPERNGGLLAGLLWLLPWLVVVAVVWWLMRRGRGDAGAIFGERSFQDFLGGRVGKASPETSTIRFADVAGQDNAKREVAELVAFLREPRKYQRLGAEPPHGVLLVGPPGTGKTLLARALAGEARVPFFHVSASEFIEVFVGVGAARVRKLFEEAKRRAPSIVFVDELDAVGRRRGTGLGGGNDEREQTLNQILSEMDGFEGHEAVVVLAATNRPDVLDPALLRPGRFDRHVTLELPDRSAREAVLRVHTARVPLDEGVDLSLVAAETPGFSGADLKNLVNEAAMEAAREGAATVCMRHFEEQREKILIGPERTLAIRPEERHRLAVHEAGHAAVAYYLPGADPLHKVTIVPHGRALGWTYLLPREERYTLAKEDLDVQLAVMLAGRTAERLLLGSASSGADDDIRRATQLARSMVARWGMAEDIGPVDLRQSEEHPFLGREIAQPRRFSEQTAHEVDDAVRDLLVGAEARAAEIIEAHRPGIEHLVAELERREALERPEIEACLGPPTADQASAAD